MKNKEPPRRLYAHEFPALLAEIPDPPQHLFVRGTLPDPSFRWLCVVGSRKHSSYGAAACQKLIRELAGYPIVVVSGLALGIDSCAHEEALRAGLPTVAVPGSGVHDDALYPRANTGLAHRIIAHGGALLSENPPDEQATVWSFPKRNRIMAGMCHATLVVEAREKSGTLITARLAMEYNRDVLVIPGPVTSPASTGSNRLLREGAHAVTSGEDVLESLGIAAETRSVPDETLTHEERLVLDALDEPQTIDSLCTATGLAPSHVRITVSLLEIKQRAKTMLGKITRI